MNFLQGHYNQLMRDGASHIEYVIINDLSDETAAELERGYRFIRECPKCEGLGFLTKGENVTGDCVCWKRYEAGAAPVEGERDRQKKEK